MCIADALAVFGVQVRQHVRGTAPDGSPRADVAVWFPDEDGTLAEPDRRMAPARVHVALVVEPKQVQPHLARLDGLVVMHPALCEPVRAAARRAHVPELPVTALRLVGASAIGRDSEKATHGIVGKKVALVDLRQDFDSEAERTTVQFALMAQDAARVVLVPHDERARARMRALCVRHGVDAWIASGPDAFAQSIGAADVFLGRPAWGELALAGLHRVAVALLPSAVPHPLLDALHGQHHLDHVLGTLHLAAFLDRRVADVGAMDARGIGLHDALFGTERDFLDVLGRVEPRPPGASTAASWEAVGPHAVGGSSPASSTVDALEPGVAPHTSRTDAIEAALAALKQKLASGHGAGPPGSTGDVA